MVEFEAFFEDCPIAIGDGRGCRIRKQLNLGIVGEKKCLGN